MTSFEYIIYP